MESNRIIVTANLNLDDGLDREITKLFLGDASDLGIDTFRLSKLDSLAPNDKDVELILFVHGDAQKLEDLSALTEDVAKRVEERIEFDSIGKIGVAYCTEGKFKPIHDLSFLSDILGVFENRMPHDPVVDLIALKYYRKEDSVFDKRVDEIGVMSVTDPEYQSELMVDLVAFVEANSDINSPNFTGNT